MEIVTQTEKLRTSKTKFHQTWSAQKSRSRYWHKTILELTTSRIGVSLASRRLGFGGVVGGVALRNVALIPISSVQRICICMEKTNVIREDHLLLDG